MKRRPTTIDAGPATTTSRRRRFRATAGAIVAAAGLVLTIASPVGFAADGNTYRNPLAPTIAGDGTVDSCADPTVIRGQNGEGRWYLYCTTDPLNDADRVSASGFHLIPMISSADLVHWTYEGDAFTTRPAYAVADAGLWAPEVVYHPDTHTYFMYYTVTNTTFAGGGSAIGVATSPTPLGPWTHAATPAVMPHAPDCCPNDKRWVFDPDVLRTDGADYIYYGSYFGGISVRQLSENGLTSDPTTQSNVAIANKFEGAEVVARGGFYYLFASATNCCVGPQTGYSVFVGRSTSPTGPFLDREGVDLNDNDNYDADPTDGRAGGTVVLSMNGNRWVGPGHNTVFQDLAGQWWTIYHAVDVTDPYFAGTAGTTNFTKRPALMDRLTWIDGWPVVRGGKFASDTPQLAPAAQPGDRATPAGAPVRWDVPGARISGFSDEFNGTSLDPAWSWVRPPTASTYRVAGGLFSMDTQAADLYVDSNNASVLTRPAPVGNYVVETRVRLTVPAEGCCPNYVQAGLVLYQNDDSFIKLVHVSIWNTRQTEFAREVDGVPAGYPRYGNTVVGPPGEWTWLRLVVRTDVEGGVTGPYGGTQRFTAYTSHDGITWTRGGTWAGDLGSTAKIGLVSMGGSGFRADFDSVVVSQIHR